MRTRPMLTPGQLYSALKEQCDARLPAACKACRVPLPYAIERPDEVSANWRIGTPTHCPKGCDLVIAEVALQLAARYDMTELARDEA